MSARPKPPKTPKIKRPKQPNQTTQGQDRWWLWLLIPLLLLGLFLGLWYFVWHWGGWGLPGNASCCTTFRFKVDAGFGVDDGSGMDTTLEVTTVDVMVVHMSADLYNLILAENLQSEADLLDYLDEHYPDGTYPIYLQLSEILFEDARGIADFDYANRSIEGITFSLCEPGVMIVPFLDFTICYANGTFYNEYEATIIEDFDVFSDLVNGTANMPPEFVTPCGGTYSIEMVSLDLAPPGETDADVTVMINGEEYDFPAEAW